MNTTTWSCDGNAVVYTLIRGLVTGGFSTIMLTALSRTCGVSVSVSTQCPLLPLLDEHTLILLYFESGFLALVFAGVQFHV